jgi:hypothetical protein
MTSQSVAKENEAVMFEKRDVVNNALKGGGYLLR